MKRTTSIIGLVVAGACGSKDVSNNKPSEAVASAPRSTPSAAPATAKPGDKVVVLDEIDPKAHVDRPFRATITVPRDATAEMTTMSSKDPDSVAHFARFQTEAWTIDVDHIGRMFRETAETILAVKPPEQIVQRETTADGGWVVIASPALDDRTKLALDAVELVHTQLALHCHAIINQHDQAGVDSALAACKSIAPR